MLRYASPSKPTPTDERPRAGVHSAAVTSHPIPLSEAERRNRDERIVRLVRAGGTPVAVAAKFGVRPRRIYEICRYHGLTFGYGGTSGRNAVRRRLYKSIVNAADEGATLSEICRRLGTTVGVVQRACLKYGGKPRREPHTLFLRMLAARRAAFKRLTRRAGSQALEPLIAAEFRSARTRDVAKLLLETDLPTTQIASQHRISPPAVLRVWTRLAAVSKRR